MTVVVMAIVFNSANAFLNGYHFVLHQDWYGQEWLTSWNFIAGSLLFALGYYITKRSDRILAGLRTDATDDYQIPRGFLYRYVSSPNYLGETVQWLGWTLMTLSPAAWVFLLWTIANLLIRFCLLLNSFIDFFFGIRLPRVFEKPPNAGASRCPLF